MAISFPRVLRGYLTQCWLLNSSTRILFAADLRRLLDASPALRWVFLAVLVRCCGTSRHGVMDNEAGKDCLNIDDATHDSVSLSAVSGGHLDIRDARRFGPTARALPGVAQWWTSCPRVIFDTS